VSRGKRKSVGEGIQRKRNYNTAVRRKVLLVGKEVKREGKKRGRA